MSRLLCALIRWTCCALLLASIAAVGLGRYAPRPANFLLYRPSPVEAVNGYHFGSAQRVPRFFDTDTGQFTRMEFPGDDYIDSAIFSTWEDEEGNSEVVGRWVRRESAGGDLSGYGLGRYKVPGGEVIDRVPLEIMPVGRPCFVPGKPSAVLFSGGDGKLYQLDFKRNREASPSAERTPGLTTIGWARSAGKPPVALNDPFWPTDKRLKGRLLATATVQQPRIEGRKVVRTSELWWLELNREGTEIVASGRLVRSAEPAAKPEMIDEGQPCVTVTPDGSLALAYLSRRPREMGWSLKIGAIEFEPESGVPVVKGESTVAIAGKRAHALPLFSRDSRWVYTLRRCDPKPDHFERTAFPRSVLPPNQSQVADLRTARAGWN